MRANHTDINGQGLEWGDLTAEFESFPGGLDTRPLLKGLPGDLCPCPHWGYLFKGKILVRYADHEETIDAGDAFYMAPGHAPTFLEDSEMFELSPSKELADVMAVVGANAEALGLDLS